MLLAHADWSVDARKRWVTFARRLPNGRFEIGAPVPVGPLPSFFTRLREMEPSGAIFAGFDFPIGLPRAYAERAGIRNFLEALRLFGSGDWQDFYEPAESPVQISCRRPFYPTRPGGARKEHLIRGLGMASGSDLLRICDGPTETRNAACEVFWLGGAAKQVGRAAIEGWHHLLAPALDTLAIWPFQGNLGDLFATGTIVAAETYPAETYGHIGIDRNFGKTQEAARQRQAGTILEWCDRPEVQLTADVRWDIGVGFGSANGDDRFDSFVGLLGMIEVLTCPEKAAVPSSAKPVEGWILGMSPQSRPAAAESSPAAAESRDRKGSLPVPRVCPACGQMTFLRWPSGWDAHAAHKCPGIEGATPEQRKSAFKARYLS